MFFECREISTFGNMTTDELQNERMIRADQLKKMRLLLGLTKDYVHKSTGLARDTIDILESGSFGWNINSEIIYTNFLQSFKK